MKRHRIHIIRSSFKMLVWCVALLSGACTDEEWNNGEGRPDGNAVSFIVTSGITSEPVTRAQPDAAEDTCELLQPLVLKASGLEQSLYLHTYVAQESERATGVPTETRAEQVDDTDDFYALNKSEGFWAKAYYMDNNEVFMHDQATAKPLSGYTNIWSTSPAYYWPNNERTLCFSAFAPMSAAEELLDGLNIKNGEIQFSYKVPTSPDKDKDAEQQPDIMFAVTECNKASSEESKVPLNFRHALSAIKFAVRDVVGGTIKKITISGVAGEGDCTYTKQADAFTWSNYGKTNCSYSQVFNYQTNDNYIPNPPGYDENEDVVLNTTIPEKTFLLIPQNIPENATIEIEFMRDSDNKLFTLKGKINDNKVTKWEPGKEYIYTISTSTSNWTYYFEVIGCEQTINNDEPEKGEFVDADGRITVNQTVTIGAYYKVKSYRERANNNKDREPVPWSAVTSDGTTTFPDGLTDFSDKYDPDSMVIKPNVWIPMKDTIGNGSIDFQEFNVTFHPQMVGTSWPGDWEMRTKTENGTSDVPMDLSMVSGSMNTANCYVVNAPGYYKFPLVYGNAIKNGVLNESSYTYSGEKSKYYPVLNNFTDYNGNAIAGAKIEGGKNAVLVWQDAYNLISDVKLNDSDGIYGTLSFKVNKEDLQQGNAVLAIRNSEGIIIWSWHIWITEYWAGDRLQLGSSDVDCDAYDANHDGFTVAPYNLGWCDPKDIWYMKRTGTMKFIQMSQEKDKKQATLDITQREAKIDYWIGNNVYYQFGRKDPIVGFMNDGSVVKYNFGELTYKIETQPKDIEDGIRNPNVLYVGGDADNNNSNDWLSSSYYNLWNNTTVNIPKETQEPENDNIDYYYSGIKTVYDPSPAGYQIPPVGFFKLITNGLYKNSDAKIEKLLDFNGYVDFNDNGYNKYYAYSKKNYKDKDEEIPKIFLTGTGHRWYTDDKNGKPGSNFNPKLVYLWSNQVNFSADTKIGYGLALGINESLYVSNFRFLGRRSMARPVRPVKLFDK